MQASRGAPSSLHWEPLARSVSLAQHKRLNVKLIHSQLPRLVVLLFIFGHLQAVLQVLFVVRKRRRVLIYEPMLMNDHLRVVVVRKKKKNRLASR